MQLSSNTRSFASATDQAACSALLRSGSRTFFAASLVLPNRVRLPAIGLYAFCRLADDAIDHGADRVSALADLRARLDSIYAGTPRDSAADRGFAQAAFSHDIPRAFPDALLEGFEWDASSRRYETLEELRAYAVRVAGTVGAMMAMVMGVRSRAQIARACDLGIAMQFTNIARDVGEDARCGRLYLPLEWMRSAGIDPVAWLSKPSFDQPLGEVVARLLHEADLLYRRADAGLALLPLGCRPGMFAARLLYAEIGREVARRGHDSVNQRAVVPWQRKTRLLANAVLAAQRGRDQSVGEPSQECAFLLDSVQDVGEKRRRFIGIPSIGDRVAWVTQLFERLERRDHPA